MMKNNMTRMLVKACIILSTVALPLLLAGCPAAGEAEHFQIFPYTCSNGVAETGSARLGQETENCASCYTGYVLDNTACVSIAPAPTDAQYTCQNGTAQSGRTGTPDSIEACILCNHGYALDNGACTGVVGPSLQTQPTTLLTLPTDYSTTVNLVADFENPQALLDAGWSATGDFVDPATADAWTGRALPNNDFGFVGERSVNTCRTGAASASGCGEFFGTLVSPNIDIPPSRPYLNFLLAGSVGIDEIAIIIQDTEHDVTDLDDPDNRIVRIQPLYVTPAYITSDFDWRSIDLSDELTEADNSIRIIIRDETLGHIHVDHFFFSEQPWGLRQDEWSRERPSFFRGDTGPLTGNTYIRLHAGGFDPGTGQPTALFGGFDDHSSFTADTGWSYPDVATSREGLGSTSTSGHTNTTRIGDDFINTCRSGGRRICAGSTGTVTSPAFTVTGRYLNFLLTGGVNTNDLTSVATVDGSVPVASTGANLEFRLFPGDNDATSVADSVMRMVPGNCEPDFDGYFYGDERNWQSVDVGAYMNQTLRFQMFDNVSSGNCGFIILDHMYFSDVPVSRDHIRAVLPFASADTTAPELVTNLRAVQGAGGAQVSWTDPFDSDLSHILLSWEPAGGDQTSPLEVAAGTRIAAITGLTDGTEYSFTAISVDTTGNQSAASAADTVVVDAIAPAIPTGLTATAVADASVSLSWTNPTDTDFSHVQLTWMPVAGLQAQPFAVQGTSAVITNLTDGTDYSFAIAGVDIAGNVSAASTDSVIATADGSVNPITGLTAAPGDTTIAVSWTAPTDSDFASVTITWTPEDGTTTQPLSVPAGTASANIDGLTNDVEYTVSVVAVDTAGNQSTAETATATPVPPDTTAPGLVTNLSAVQAAGGATVSWTEPSDADLSHILLTWNPIGGDQTSPLRVAAGTTTTTITGLTHGTQYSFTAVSVDTTGNQSAASQAGTVVVDAQAPTAPADLAAVAAANASVSLSWTNPTDTDFAHVLIRWTPAAGDQTSPLMVQGTSTTITGLTNGAQYSFTIAGVDTLGNVSSASTAVTATADSVVNAVTGLTATPGDGTIAVSWTAPTDSDFASVTITWAPEGGTTTQPLSVATGTTTANIAGLTNGTEYTVSVVAVDTAGNQSSAETAKATPVSP